MDGLGGHLQDSWQGFLQALANSGQRPALTGTDRVTLTFADLLGRRDAWRYALDGAGITTSHRVATLLPDSASTASALLSMIDAVSLMPLNPAGSTVSLARLLADAGVDAVVCAAELLPQWQDALDALEDIAVFVVAGGDQTIQLQGAAAPPTRIDRTPGLVLQTSGSTGTPKRVPLTPDQLVLSAAYIARHLELTGDDRVVHALPMFHIGAIVDLLIAPLLTGGSAIIAGDQTPERIRDAILDQGATWLQLVPTSLRRLVETTDPAEARAITERLRLIRMVSADLPDHLLQQTRAMLPDSVILQMYGMTETTGQITSQPPDPGAQLTGSVGRAAGPEIALIDGQGALVATGREGEVCVRGPTVMAGYEGADETPRYGTWFRTGDLGRLDAEGNLFLTGRLKEQINRGGEKISPLVIERATRALPGVVEAVAYPVPHPTLGEQPQLAIIGDGTLREADVLDTLRPQLAPHEMPRHIRFLTELPRLPSGKTDRRALAAQAPDADQVDPVPESEMGRIVSRLWQDALKCRAPHAGSDFFEDGGDSLSATEFVIRLSDALSDTLPPNILFNAPRFGQLVAVLEQRQDGEVAANPGEPPFLRYVRDRMAGWRGEPAGPRGLIIARNTFRDGPPVFFCSNGLLLPDRFETKIFTDHPLYLLRSLHGMEKTWRRHLDALADIYADEIRTLVTPGEPFFLGGFCAGAIVMSAVADRLAAIGLAPQHFIAVDSMLTQPTVYPVFYVWSDDPRFSAAAIFEDPRRGFGWLHPQGADYVHCPTRHIELLAGPDTTRPVCKALMPVLAGDPAPLNAHPEELMMADRRARHSAKIRVSAPLVLPRSSAKDVTVTVTNTSGQVWPETATSGLYMSLGYEGLRGTPFLPRRSVLALAQPLAPGQSVSARFQVTWPDADHSRPLFMCLAMMDDGFGAFHESGRGLARRLVFRGRG